MVASNATNAAVASAAGATGRRRIPSPRAAAYLVLWGLLALLIWWRTPPAAHIEFIPAAEQPAPFHIDLNRDPPERLRLIPGIGESLARRLVEARERCGGFRSLDEAMAVAGVPDRALVAAADWLVLDGAPARARGAEPDARAAPSGQNAASRADRAEPEAGEPDPGGP